MALSLTRFKNLRSVFRSDAPTMADACIAQCMVLYEDLRIELQGILVEELGALDGTDVKYRRHYFLRRAIGTWSEFAEVILLLERLDEFSAIKQYFAPSSVKRWNRAARFFHKYQPVVKAVRNDIGGHFGTTAARYAVENFRDDVLGKFELIGYDAQRAGMRAYFAGEIVATATFRHLPGGSAPASSVSSYRRLLRIVRAGWRHGTHATDAIVANYLWDRFG